MLSDAEKTLICESWRLVIPIADTAADLFYQRLFELRPDLRALFGEDMSMQKKKLVAMLNFMVKSLDWPESAWREEVGEESDLFLVMLALGRRHTDLYRVPDESYDSVGEALLWTLDYALGKKFDAGSRAAWSRLYTLAAAAMKMGRLSVHERAASDAGVASIVNSSAAQRRGAVS